MPQVANNRKSTTSGVMHTVYTDVLYARECVRIYSGFSKRIPRLGSPEGGTAHYQRSQSEVDRVRVHITPHTELREMGALDQGHI